VQLKTVILTSLSAKYLTKKRNNSETSWEIVEAAVVAVAERHAACRIRRKRTGIPAFFPPN